MHSYHHQMYVPYAFGAFYNTLAEAFLLDTVGTTLSLALSGLSIRQSMCFGTISVLKGVDDHCGYRLPWDPLQWGNEQNTDFHDVHHQSWGMKVRVTSVLLLITSASVFCVLPFLVYYLVTGRRRRMELVFLLRLAFPFSSSLSRIRARPEERIESD